MNVPGMGSGLLRLAALAAAAACVMRAPPPTHAAPEQECAALAGANGRLTNATQATVIAVAERRPKDQSVDITRAALKKAAEVAIDKPELTKRAQDLLQQMENEK